RAVDRRILLEVTEMMERDTVTAGPVVRAPNRGLADVWETTKPKIEYAELSDTYGKFIVEPLERGFGVTLGNALRRVLLSSISGAAVTSVRIESVLHEFSTIPGGRGGRDAGHPQPEGTVLEAAQRQ